MRGTLLAPPRFLLAFLLFSLCLCGAARAKISPWVSSPPRILFEIEAFLQNTLEQAENKNAELALRILTAQIRSFLGRGIGPEYLRASLRLALEAAECQSLPDAYSITHRALVSALDQDQLFYMPALGGQMRAMNVLRYCADALEKDVRLHVFLTFHRGLHEADQVIGDAQEASVAKVLELITPPQPRRKWWKKKPEAPTRARIHPGDALGILEGLTRAIHDAGSDYPGRVFLKIARAIGESESSAEARLLAMQEVTRTGLQLQKYRQTGEAVVRAALDVTAGIDSEQGVAYFVDAIRRELGE